MKITLNQARKATASLSILGARQCPITTAFKLATFSDAIMAQVVRFEKEINERIKQHGYDKALPESATPEEIAQRQAQIKAFSDEVNESAEQELIEVPEIKLTLAELGSAETTPEALQGIGFCIKDPEKEYTPVDVTPMERMQ